MPVACMCVCVLCRIAITTTDTNNMPHTQKNANAAHALGVLMPFERIAVRVCVLSHAINIHVISV